MKDFAAIDFETANWELSSVCSVGIVVVRDGCVAEKFYELIKPEPEWYAYWNTRVHGLTLRDTCDALTFDKVWSKAEHLLDGLPLVAHNSAFDERCLRSAFRTYGMTYPDYRFHCTCRAARIKIPKHVVPNYKLHTVAAYCGFDLSNHHHALSDAEACAAIAIRIL
ncbi:MAG: 3'-5' exonuclease [Tannerella sp.]|jgi:DNA polymerase-3 subunit epsilon|nr:3'-5' exonuclease [Tannerella sp.]